MEKIVNISLESELFNKILTQAKKNKRSVRAEIAFILEVLFKNK